MNAVEFACICREIFQSLPRYQSEKAAALRRALDPDDFPADVDQNALFAGVELWPVLDRLRAHVHRSPDLWPDGLVDDLEVVALAAEGKLLLLAPSPNKEASPLNPPVAADGKVMNPAALAAAISGDRVAVGDVYRIAANWLGSGDLSKLLAAIGTALRISSSADELWKAARPQGLKGRQEIAARYAIAANWLEKGADGRIPPDLAIWLSKRLEAMAEVIVGHDKPANAVYRACGAGREGRPGRLEDSWTSWRDAAIADDVRRLRRMCPARKDQAHYLEIAERWFPSKYFPAKPGESEGDRIQRHAESVKKASQRLFPN